MTKLHLLLSNLENNIATQQLIAPSVSATSSGWHLEHSLLVINTIIGALKKSDPSSYQPSFNFKRSVVFAFRKIPRGRAKAPSRVHPAQDIDAEGLKSHLAATFQKLKELDDLRANHYFEHPFFGQLNKKATVKFLEIHTEHHLHIIKDIVKNNNKNS